MNARPCPLLILLWANTRKANLGRWVDRAVDYRYIAERLRALHYLPLAGSWRPPEPAAMASLNGVMAEAELARLGDRSGHLADILGGDGSGTDAPRLAQFRALRRDIEAAAQPDGRNPGSWGLETLWLAKSIATVCVREVADWAVLYAKPVPES